MNAEQSLFIRNRHIARELISSAALFENSNTNKRKIWAKKWLLRRNEKGCYENLMRELALENEESYRRVIQMDTSTFKNLLEQISPLNKKEETKLRKTISVSERLTLQYLVTGETQRSLSFQFRIVQNTISVCRTLYEALKKDNLWQHPKAKQNGLRYWKIFFNVWNFPVFRCRKVH